MSAIVGSVVQQAMRSLCLGRAVILDLHGAYLLGADMRDADLTDADMSGADLGGADLGGADMRGPALDGADLSDADMRGADLTDADMSGADLCDANLRGADLSDADMSGANLSGAALGGADMRGANLRGAVGLVELPACDPRGHRLIATDQGARGWLLTAGCRGPWTVAEARAHWGSEDYDGDPLTARRYLAALDWWEREGADYRAAAGGAS